MGPTMARQPDTIDKLVELAGGDLDLVQEAIGAMAGGRRRAADLEAVVKYIVHRREQPANTAT